jgi:hypothetical protein
LVALKVCVAEEEFVMPEEIVSTAAELAPKVNALAPLRNVILETAWFAAKVGPVLPELLNWMAVAEVGTALLSQLEAVLQALVPPVQVTWASKGVSPSTPAQNKRVRSALAQYPDNDNFEAAGFLEPEAVGEKSISEQRVKAPRSGSGESGSRGAN